MDEFIFGNFILSVYLSLCQYHTALIIITLWYIWKSRHMMPPTLLLFLKVASAIWHPLWFHISFLLAVVQLLTYVWLFVTPWTAACQASQSSTISQSLIKLLFIILVMPSNHLILCHLLLLLPSIFPSIRVFPNELSLCIRWSKYWSFSFRISPSNEYSGLISFKSDWLDLLAVQGTLESFLQHHSSKA